MALNLAFLGCGFATQLHSRTLRRFPELHCFYASRDAARAKAYAARFHGQGWFASYHAALESPDVHAVLVATPPAHHLTLTLQALQAGKHVIVEKPAFLHSNDFEPVRKAAAATGRRVFVAENYAYKPLRATLRKLLQHHAVGEVLLVHINALKRQPVRGWRGDPQLAGGGALFEGGIHWIALLTGLGLTVTGAYGWFPGSSSGMDRSVLATFDFAEGAVGTLYYSWETPSLFKGLRLSKIYGRDGSLTFESNGLFVAVRGRVKRLIFPGLRDIAGYRAMFADFFASLANATEPSYTLDCAERDLRLVESIYQHRRTEGYASATQPAGAAS